MLTAFDDLAGTHGFRVIDGSRSIYEIQQDLRREIRDFLDLDDAEGVVHIEEFTARPGERLGRCVARHPPPPVDWSRGGYFVWEPRVARSRTAGDLQLRHAERAE